MLNVAVLCSKRAPGLEALRERVHVACVLDRRLPRLRDREAFDAETAAILRPFDVDAVVLLGYLYVISDPLLSAFPDRILNVHDADLSLRKAGGPKYPGLHATRDAIMAGERETRSSVHLVTPQLDGGPVIARSEAFPVAPFIHEAVARGEDDIVRAYAYAQREWMMRSSWGELAAEGLAMLSRNSPCHPEPPELRSREAAEQRRTVEGPPAETRVAGGTRQPPAPSGLTAGGSSASYATPPAATRLRQPQNDSGICAPAGAAA
jgi:folate-dependent phosphoribosylglycinamide formyltransferase PurN